MRMPTPWPSRLTSTRRPSHVDGARATLAMWRRRPRASIRCSLTRWVRESYFLTPASHF